MQASVGREARVRTAPTFSGHISQTPLRPARSRGGHCRRHSLRHWTKEQPTGRAEPANCRPWSRAKHPYKPCLPWPQRRCSAVHTKTSRQLRPPESRALGLPENIERDHRIERTLSDTCVCKLLRDYTQRSDQSHLTGHL